MGALSRTVPCQADGFEFDAPVGASLMVALKGTGFNIEASCEGCMACGTCHVQLQEDWVTRVPPPGEDEQAMLASLPNATPCSRLSCQIEVTHAMAGLCLAIPH